MSHGRLQADLSLYELTVGRESRFGTLNHKLQRQRFLCHCLAIVGYPLIDWSPNEKYIALHVQVQIDQCPVVSTIPRSISCTNDLIHILTACSNSHVCSGNPTEDFSELVRRMEGYLRVQQVFCMHDIY